MTGSGPTYEVTVTRRTHESAYPALLRVGMEVPLRR